jgi:hypothetical protein
MEDDEVAPDAAARRSHRTKAVGASVRREPCNRSTFPQTVDNDAGGIVGFNEHTATEATQNSFSARRTPAAGNC